MHFFFIVLSWIDITVEEQRRPPKESYYNHMSQNAFLARCGGLRLLSQHLGGGARGLP